MESGQLQDCAGSRNRGHETDFGPTVVVESGSGLHAEDPRDEVRREHVAGFTVGLDTSLVQDEHRIGVPNGGLQFVEDADHGCAPVCEAPHVVEEFVPVMDVQERGRLIEQEDAGTLDQGLGEQDASLFTARQGQHRPALEALEVDRRQGRPCEVVVLPIVRNEPVLVWGAAEQDELLDREIEAEAERLAYERHAAGKVFRRPSGERDAVERQVAGIRKQPADRAQQRGFPASVGAYDTDPASRVEVEGQRVQDFPTGEAYRKVAGFENGHRGGGFGGNVPGCPGVLHSIEPIVMRLRPVHLPILLVAFVLAIVSAGCDTQENTEAYVAAASREPVGYTKTDTQGTVTTEDQDDWRTAPIFIGKVRIDPAWPNPTRGTIVTIPVSVLEFEAVRGGLVLRTRDPSGRLSILDEIPDATSPGAYVFQFTPALIGRTGLVRLFVLDRFGELVSYGDLLLE